MSKADFERAQKIVQEKWEEWITSSPEDDERAAKAVHEAEQNVAEIYAKWENEIENERSENE